MSAAAAGWAAGLAAASVALAGGGGGRVLLGRVRRRGGGRGRPAWRPRPGAVGWGAAGAVVVAAAVGRPLLGLAAASVLACVARERRAASRVRAAAAEERRVREFAVLVAAELRAGRPARDAVGRAARAVALLAEAPPRPARAPAPVRARTSPLEPARASLPGPADGPVSAPASVRLGTRGGAPASSAGSWAAPVAAAAESGDDVGDALEAASERPGAGVLRDLAACWRVAEGTGAGLAAALDVVAAGLRDREAQRRELAAQLAGVRASGWLLAALPAFGLVLGGALGAQPWRVLLDTGAGNAALAAGLALDVAGLAWLGRLVRGVQR